jgi:glycosyltransferase involved in cell wall biosynthesis
MRILIVSELPIPSRRKSYRADPLAKYLSKTGHEVTVICPKNLPQSQKELEDYKNVTFSYITQKSTPHNPLNRLFVLFSMAKKIRRELKEKKFDVIRPISFLPAYATILANKRKVPLVVNLSDFYSDLYKQFGLPFTSIVANVVKNMEKAIVTQSDVLIVDSPTQRKYWKYWGLEEKRGVVLPNGVDRELFNSEINKEEAKLRFGIDKNKKIVFYSGDISRLDGLDVLLKAAPLVIKEIKDIKFVIVGNGSKYANKLKRFIERNEFKRFFMFTGWVPHVNIPQYIAVADVCVAPFRLTLTSSSNLMNKIIEYLAMKKSIVATASPALKEMVGDIINYIDPENPHMLANAILHALKERPSQDKLSKMQRIAEKLDWKRIVQHEEKIINSLIENKNQDFRKLDYLLIN